MGKYLRLGILSVTLIGQFLIGSVSGAILNVPLDYGHIQDAIGASSAGDTILIADGMYNERLKFPDHAVVVGSYLLLDDDPIHAILTTIDADTTLLGPADTGCVVYFPPETDTTTRLVGLTIRHGIGLLRPSQSFYRDGGGIYCDGGSPVIERCVLRTNHVTSSGGGLLIANGSAAIVRSCLIEENEAELYGGGAAASYSAPSFYSCRLKANATPGLGTGGGLDLFESESNLTGCWFEGNSAGFAGGGISCYNSPAEIDSCVMDSNSSFYGGAMYVYGAPPKISNLTAIQNDATLGGGFYIENSDMSLSSSIIAFGLHGAAVSAHFDSELMLSCCDIYGNAGGDWLGEIADQLGVRGNISRDPMFCGFLDQDYAIDVNSPCAPGGSCFNLIGALETSCAGVLSTVMVPARFSVAEGNGVPARMASVVLGNFAGDIAVEDVDLGSLRVNDTLLADSVRILAAHPDFSGRVIELALPLRTIIDHYGLIWDTLATTYNVTGTSTGGDIELSGLVTILGHISGDLNRDGSRDISDLVAMVDYFFNGGSPPAFPAAADMNHDGSSDISDLIALVGKLFPAPPQPLPPR
ncbi:MAG: right-handed parallel beta-helix repeat-containing protein [bacterium]